MRILVVGANGQIGRKLIRCIADSGHASRAMIREAAQADALHGLGADETVVADLEGDVSASVKGCEAVVFAAASGGDTGPEKTVAVDRDAAIAMIEAAREAGVERFVMVSSMGASDPRSGPEGLRHYLVAKQAAEKHLRGSGPDFTIVRPGGLTDEPGTGAVELGPNLGHSGKVSRSDVAAILLAILDASATAGKTCELLKDKVPIAQAVSTF